MKIKYILKPVYDWALRERAQGFPGSGGSAPAWPRPGAWHRASPQDKGTKPLEAPRYLFLPQSIKGQTKEHSDSTQCAKFVETKWEASGHAQVLDQGQP